MFREEVQYVLRFAFLVSRSGFCDSREAGNENKKRETKNGSLFNPQHHITSAIRLQIQKLSGRPSLW